MPGVAGGVDDVAVGSKTRWRGSCRARTADLLDRVQLWQREGSRMGVMFSGHLRSPAMCQPGDRAAARRGRPGDVERISSMWSCIISVSAKGSASARRRPWRADRPKEVGALVALVGRLAGPCDCPGPLSHQAVLLADPGLSWNQISIFLLRVTPGGGPRACGGSFLNAAMTSPSCLG